MGPVNRSNHLHDAILTQRKLILSAFQERNSFSYELSFTLQTSIKIKTISQRFFQFLKKNYISKIQ